MELLAGISSSKELGPARKLFRGINHQAAASDDLVYVPLQGIEGQIDHCRVLQLLEVANNVMIARFPYQLLLEAGKIRLGHDRQGGYARRQRFDTVQPKTLK